MKIGVIGTVFSGKTTVAKIFEKHGMLYIPNERKGFLRRIPNIKSLDRDLVIDNIFSSGQVEKLREEDDFYLLYVDQSVNTRFLKWANFMQEVIEKDKSNYLKKIASQITRDSSEYYNFTSTKGWMNFETFRKNNYDYKVESILEKYPADYIIENDTNLESLEKKVDELYKKLQ